MMPRGWLPGLSLPAPAPASQGQRVLLPAVTRPPGRKLPSVLMEVAPSPGHGGAGSLIFLLAELGFLPLEGRAASSKRPGYTGSLLARLGQISRQNFWMKTRKVGKK